MWIMSVVCSFTALRGAHTLLMQLKPLLRYYIREGAYTTTVHTYVYMHSTTFHVLKAPSYPISCVSLYRTIPKNVSLYSLSKKGLRNHFLSFFLFETSNLAEALTMVLHKTTSLNKHGAGCMILKRLYVLMCYI